MKVLVTGATGEVGSELVNELLQREAGVRALTRKQRKPDTFPDAVEMAVGDLSDPLSIGEAIKGVDKLFLLIGAENVPVELTQALTAYGLAKKAGVKHVTYASVYKADQFLECRILLTSMPSRKRFVQAGCLIRFCGRRTSLRMSFGSRLI